MFAIFCNMSSAITVNVVSFPFNYLNYFIIICLCLTYNIIILYTSYFRINKNNKSNYNIDNNKNDAYNKNENNNFYNINIYNCHLKSSNTNNNNNKK